MKTEQILLKFSVEEIEQINEAFKKFLISSNEVITRSEFVRRMIKSGLTK